MAKQKPKRPKKSLLDEFINTLPPPATNNRREGTVGLKKYFLLICEGEKTEPNYFKSLREFLPEHMVDIEISGEGRNTVGVVKSAILKRQGREQNKLLPPFDEVYAIFDKDDFPDEHFNEAVSLCEKENIHPTYSNEAFELWYVLHFQYLDTGISRKEYQNILAKILGKCEKNQPDMYSILQEKGNEAQAMKWAEKLLLEKALNNPAKEKPATRVHELVKRLNEFKENP
ncbi:MAG: RloB domain-containing protein [Bacteroidetes bacterium]|nr:RloB domain-containing protein [Bacteroidota bacterium]